ncbi:MAG TPA: protease complex subunit PrcB family protein [Bacillota bacterium]|nr:protease complex subunit PrcB family protein [Bacillota bacterium]
MKPQKVILLSLVGLLIFGTSTIIFYVLRSAAQNRLKQMVLTQLPFEIEKTNPVPEVRHWIKNGKTYYYFNWGMKSTGGYSLELAGVEKNLIKIRALAPKKDQMVTETLTFPSLYLALPEARYKYQVSDADGKQLDHIFTSTNPPLIFRVFLPCEGRIVPRRILRDPYYNNEGKTTALIALDALFNQEEMLDFVSEEVIPEGASVSTQAQKWVVLMNQAFDQLDWGGKDLVTQLIQKTVLDLKTPNIKSVEITTDPKKLPPLEN